MKDYNEEEFIDLLYYLGFNIKTFIIEDNIDYKSPIVYYNKKQNIEIEIHVFDNGDVQLYSNNIGDYGFEYIYEMKKVIIFLKKEFNVEFRKIKILKLLNLYEN